MKTQNALDRVPRYDLPAVALAGTAAALSMEERMALDGCERVIAQGLDTFADVAQAFAMIRARKLYRAEFGTFEQYCGVKWQFSARRGRQISDAGSVIRNL